jgi:Flp pilus assembly pilin Flp
MLKFFKKLVEGEEGTETVEWAILGALLLAVAAGAWTSLGNAVVQKITSVVTSFS